MNQNPSDMSNEDLEKDMAARNEADHTKKADLKESNPDEETELPEEESMDMGVEFSEEKEQDLDDLLHQQGEIKHTGTMPDPEELKFRESQ
jgi:hypothetical protein